MTNGDAVHDSGDILDREITLFEYGTCPKRGQSAILFEQRHCLELYLQQRWLKLDFEDGKPCIRAVDRVGVLPFSVDGKSHIILIAPKGCQQQEELEKERGLLRFLELLAFDDRGTSPEVEFGWEGKLGPHRFLLFLAHHYARLLKELCHRDFRSYYRAEENDLRGHIRGRLHLSRYARNALQGKQHILPCRWDEFTVDNWDNRILWAAARRLKEVASTFDPGAAQLVWKPFLPLLSWFGSVSDVPITVTDLHRSRLGRTSAYYRRALVWARLLLQGSNLPGAGGQVPPIVLDAPAAFEKFAEVVILAAIPEGWTSGFQNQNKQEFLKKENSAEFLSGKTKFRVPDILLSGPERRRAVGDAKYKDVLERSQSEQLETVREVILVGIQEDDWNQLYVYMRLTGASSGFFVVPIWKAHSALFEWIDDFRFAVSPCEGAERVAVLGLNLLQPLRDVKRAAAVKLREWLSGT